MLFDTDILIWVQRGNKKAALVVEEAQERCISIFTLMELLQGANNKRQHDHIKNFIQSFNFKVLSLTDNIGHRALIYVEQYALGHGLTAADAIIAATSAELGMPLVSGNVKHFRPITGLVFHDFHP